MNEIQEENVIEKKERGSEVCQECQGQMIKYNEGNITQNNDVKKTKQLFVTSIVTNDKEEVGMVKKNIVHKEPFLVIKNTPTITHTNNTSSTCSSIIGNCNNRNNNNIQLKKDDIVKKLRTKSNNNENNINNTPFDIHSYSTPNIPKSINNDEHNEVNAHPNQIEYQNKDMYNIEEHFSEQTEDIHIERNNISNIPPFKETYLDLLITSADSLIQNGLNLSTIPHHHSIHNNKSSHKHSTPYKCDNKICSVIFNKYKVAHIAKMKSLHNKIFHFCINCYQAFQKQQYCYYCGTIYREYNNKKGESDNKVWIGCDYCSNWEHMQCEEVKGLIKDVGILIKDRNFKYKCPFCRDKDKKGGKGNVGRFVKCKRKGCFGKEGSLKNERGIKKKKICNFELDSDVEKILMLEKE